MKRLSAISGVNPGLAIVGAGSNPPLHACLLHDFVHCRIEPGDSPYRPMGIEGGAQMTKFRHLRIASVLGTFVAMAFSGGASADPFTFFNQPNVAQPSPPAQASAMPTARTKRRK